ncbi:MAG: gamma-glutamylcyclotransferase [Alphaproteobacteria bacterium]|nr:gamma-glutamylcyclotransferase [Alphaproteobacteria bacterium]
MRYYFAYASNIDLAAMRARCPGARVVGVAVLANHRFRIVRSGYASVLRATGSRVFGLLWWIRRRDEAALDAYEETGRGLYRRRFLKVVTLDGRPYPALVYVARGNSPGKPRHGYLEPIIAAARQAHLPAETIAVIIATARGFHPLRRRVLRRNQPARPCVGVTK